MEINTSQILKGTLEACILQLIKNKDMYGYEMIETLRERSMNVFSLKAGTLYPILHKLEEQGYVETYEEEIGGKTRKYYTLTKAGKKQLLVKKEEWEEYSQAVGRVLGGVCYG